MATFKGIKLPDGTVYTPEGSGGTAENGLPAGGVDGQALIKSSAANYEADWEDIHQIPSGGTAGQVLTKDTGTNYDVSWKTLQGLLPTGGSAGQFLRKKSATNYAVEWADAPESGGGAGITESIVINQTFNGNENANTVEATFSTAKNLRMIVVDILGNDASVALGSNAMVIVSVSGSQVKRYQAFISGYHNCQSQLTINLYDTFYDMVCIRRPSSNSEEMMTEFQQIDGSLTNQTDITSISVSLMESNKHYPAGTKIRVITYE